MKTLQSELNDYNWLLFHTFIKSEQFLFLFGCEVLLCDSFLHTLKDIEPVEAGTGVNGLQAEKGAFAAYSF